MNCNEVVDAMVSAAKTESVYRTLLDESGRMRSRDWRTPLAELINGLDDMSGPELMRVYEARSVLLGAGDDGASSLEALGDRIIEALERRDPEVEFLEGPMTSIVGHLTHPLGGDRWDPSDMRMITYSLRDSRWSKDDIGKLYKEHLLNLAWGHSEDPISGSSVRMATGHNADWDPMSEVLVNGGVTGVAEALAEHPNTPPDVLAQLFNEWAVTTAGERLAELSYGLSLETARMVESILAQMDRRWESMSPEESDAAYVILDSIYDGLAENPVVIDERAFWKKVMSRYYEESADWHEKPDIRIRWNLHEFLDDKPLPDMTSLTAGVRPLSRIGRTVGEVVFTKFELPFIDTDGREHPMVVSGNHAKCGIHDDAVVRDMRVTSKLLPCRQLARRWSDVAFRLRLRAEDQYGLGADRSGERRWLIGAEAQVLSEAAAALSQQTGWSQELVEAILPANPDWMQDPQMFDTWVEWNATDSERVELNQYMHITDVERADLYQYTPSPDLTEL